MCPELCHAQLLLTSSSNPQSLSYSHFSSPILFYIFRTSPHPWTRSVDLYRFSLTLTEISGEDSNSIPLIQESAFGSWTNLSVYSRKNLLYLIFALEWTMNNLWLLNLTNTTNRKTGHLLLEVTLNTQPPEELSFSPKTFFFCTKFSFQIVIWSPGISLHRKKKKKRKKEKT